MSDIRLNLAEVDFAQDAETREAKHELLASFLGAYADGELPPETQSQIDAHLTGCARCRRELDVHRAVRERLGNEPVPAATAALRKRIELGIKNAPPPTLAPAVEPAFQVAVRPRRAFPAWAVGGIVLTFAAVGLFVAREWGLSPRAPQPVTIVASQGVPLFNSVLEDYRRVAAGSLPGRARDLAAVRAAVPFAFNVLPNPSLRLLAAWTTSLAGEPAAVLAYRWNDRMVLQYFVTDELVFQSPGVRASLAQKRAVSMTSGGQGMLLWAEPEYGTVLVGDLTPAEFATLRDSTRTH